jgi:beta-N-acetylhexosaminidase
MSDLCLDEQISLLIRPGRETIGPGAATGRIYKDVVATVPQVREVTLGLAPSTPPLALTANQEGGRLNAADWPGVTLLPGAMALGAIGDTGLAEEAGKAIGGQLRALGLRWNLAPVCDVLDPWHNPALGTRCFSADPARVGEMAAAFTRGLQTQGVAATAKHFPGLGRVAADPHHTVPAAHCLSSSDLLPFRAVIDVGVASIMVGSQVVRPLDHTAPALASSRVIELLLRGAMGFEGVVMTENLSIPSIAQRLGGVGEAAVKAVVAGADIVLLDSEIARAKGHSPAERLASQEALIRRRVVVHEALKRAHAAGRISPQRLASAVARILKLHERYGVKPGDGLSFETAERHARRVATIIATRATHLVSDDPSALPLRPGTGAIGVVTISPTRSTRADSAWRSSMNLTDHVVQYHSPVLELGLEGLENRRTLPGTLLLVTYNLWRDPTRMAQLRQAMSEVPAETTIVHIALGEPHDLSFHLGGVRLAAYSPHTESLEAVAKMLFQKGPEA